MRRNIVTDDDLPAKAMAATSLATMQAGSIRRPQAGTTDKWTVPYGHGGEGVASAFFSGSPHDLYKIVR
jgi:hypothetical protein